MMKILRVLIILATLTITSGCASTDFVNPLCYPPRPVLEAVSVEEQLLIRQIDRDLWYRIAGNDLKLKGRVALLEKLADAHNEQFEAECP